MQTNRNEQCSWAKNNKSFRPFSSEKKEGKNWVLTSNPAKIPTPNRTKRGKSDPNSPSRSWWPAGCVALVRTSVVVEKTHNGWRHKGTFIQSSIGCTLLLWFVCVVAHLLSHARVQYTSNIAQKTVAQIPLLTTKAGPRDGDAWIKRLKEEYTALIKVRHVHKSNTDPKLSVCRDKQECW